MPGMGRGDRSKVRWKNDRVKKKKERDRRKAEAAATSAPAEDAADR
jgi:hypothetical protein